MTKSQFFKYLEAGGPVRMISFHGQAVPASHELGQIRRADKVQTNGVRFNNGSWLFKHDVNAADVRPVYAGGNQPAVSIGWAVYQLGDQ